MARPSDGYTIALLEGPPQLVGARCPRCGTAAAYPLVLPRATPLVTLTRVIPLLGDVAAILHVCPDPPHQAGDT